MRKDKLGKHHKNLKRRGSVSKKNLENCRISKLFVLDFWRMFLLTEMPEVIFS